MTEEQFEALKAWICSMRDFERSREDAKRSIWLINLGECDEAAEKLARAEERARVALVEDKP